MTQQAISDANFYSLVHYVLESQRESARSVKVRGAERHQFMCLQFVAPYCDGQMPSEHEFEQVLCLDLSLSGMSYLVSRPPATEYLIAGIGEKRPLFYSAQVIRIRPYSLAEQDLILVGVQFMSRVATPNYGPLLAPPPAYAAKYLGPLE